MVIANALQLEAAKRNVSRSVAILGQICTANHHIFVYYGSFHTQLSHTYYKHNFNGSIVGRYVYCSAKCGALLAVCLG